MSGVGLTYDLSAIERLNARIAALGDVNRRKLLDVVGALVETQTRKRLASEKTAPDGTPWPAWSARYEKGRHGGHSLLQGRGDLSDSLTHEVSSDQVEIGSNLIYARVHQDGSGEDPVKVPAHQRRITQAFGRKLAFPVWVDVGAHDFVQGIPARPYIGLSIDNEAELEATIDQFLSEVLP
jgi:phage virion morphogenesis protein